MRSWPAHKKSGDLAKRFGNPAAYERFSMVWDQYHAQTVDSWDGPWTYALVEHDGLSINPSVNLISYIGNDSGYHVEMGLGKNYTFGDAPTTPIRFPLVHPSTIKVRRAADAYTYRYEFNIDRRLIDRLTRPLKTRFPRARAAYSKIKARLKGTR
jgi:hypothetical protein